MKSINKYLLFAFLAIFTFSCSEDDDFVAEAKDTSSFLITSTNPASLVLSIANENNTAHTLVWERASYTVGTSITYDTEFSSTSDFATIVSGGTTTSNNISWTQKQLNTVALALDYSPFVEATIYLRVKASIGTTGSVAQYSDVLNFKITPYTSELPKIAVPGDHQGWTPSNAPLLAASGYGKTDYEGYVNLSTQFKFVAPDASGVFAWTNTNWGDDGSFSGVLTVSGENISTTAGYYLVKADTGKLTYSITKTDWAVTGDATPNGWPDPALDHDMTYNATTLKWEITLALKAGELKFRANNKWDINLGADGSDDDTSMDYGGPNIKVDAAGTYKIELDLSSPRNYQYTITKQ